MFAFGSNDYWMDQLDDETKQRLASLLENRNVYLLHFVELNRMRILQLTNPSPENAARMDQYVEQHMAPIREQMMLDSAHLLETAIDMDAIKEMLPMLLAGVMQKVNLPLLLHDEPRPGHHPGRRPGPERVPQERQLIRRTT